MSNPQRRTVQRQEDLIAMGMFARRFKELKAGQKQQVYIRLAEMYGTLPENNQRKGELKCYSWTGTVVQEMLDGNYMIKSKRSGDKRIVGPRDAKALITTVAETGRTINLNGQPIRVEAVNLKDYLLRQQQDVLSSPGESVEHERDIGDADPDEEGPSGDSGGKPAASDDDDDKTGSGEQRQPGDDRPSTESTQGGTAAADDDGGDTDASAPDNDDDKSGDDPAKEQEQQQQQDEKEDPPDTNQVPEGSSPKEEEKKADQKEKGKEKN